MRDVRRVRPLLGQVQSTLHAPRITGGSSGFGAATARRLLDQGHRVAITGRDRTRLDRFAEELHEPPGLLTIAGDASDYDAVDSAVQLTIKAFGHLDTALANAGIATHDTLAETPFWDGFGRVPDGQLLTAEQIADSIPDMF